MYSYANIEIYTHTHVGLYIQPGSLHVPVVISREETEEGRLHTRLVSFIYPHGIVQSR